MNECMPFSDNSTLQLRTDRQNYKMANVILAVWLACSQLVANPVYIYEMPTWADLSSDPAQNSVNHRGMGCGLLRSLFAPGGNGHGGLMHTLMPPRLCGGELDTKILTAFAVWFSVLKKYSVDHDRSNSPLWLKIFLNNTVRIENCVSLIYLFAFLAQSINQEGRDSLFNWKKSLRVSLNQRVRFQDVTQESQKAV